MSLSGMIYAFLTSAAYTLLAAGYGGWSFVIFTLSVVFMSAAIYHDDKQERRIAQLEKELAKRSADDGRN